MAAAAGSGVEPMRGGEEAIEQEQVDKETKLLKEVADNKQKYIEKFIQNHDPEIRDLYREGILPNFLEEVINTKEEGLKDKLKHPNFRGNRKEKSGYISPVIHSRFPDIENGHDSAITLSNIDEAAGGGGGGKPMDASSEGSEAAGGGGSAEAMESEEDIESILAYSSKDRIAYINTCLFCVMMDIKNVLITKQVKGQTDYMMSIGVKIEDNNIKIDDKKIDNVILVVEEGISAMFNKSSSKSLNGTITLGLANHFDPGPSHSPARKLPDWTDPVTHLNIYKTYMACLLQFAGIDYSHEKLNSFDIKQVPNFFKHSIMNNTISPVYAFALQKLVGMYELDYSDYKNIQSTLRSILFDIANKSKIPFNSQFEIPYYLILDCVWFLMQQQRINPERLLKNLANEMISSIKSLGDLITGLCMYGNNTAKEVFNMTSERGFKNYIKQLKELNFLASDAHHDLTVDNVYSLISERVESEKIRIQRGRGREQEGETPLMDYIEDFEEEEKQYLSVYTTYNTKFESTYKLLEKYVQIYKGMSPNNSNKQKYLNYIKLLWGVMEFYYLVSINHNGYGMEGQFGYGVIRSMEELITSKTSDKYETESRLMGEFITSFRSYWKILGVDVENFEVLCGDLQQDWLVEQDVQVDKKIYVDITGDDKNVMERKRYIPITNGDVNQIDKDVTESKSRPNVNDDIQAVALQSGMGRKILIKRVSSKRKR